MARTVKPKKWTNFNAVYRFQFYGGDDANVAAWDVEEAIKILRRVDDRRIKNVIRTDISVYHEVSE